MANRVVVSRDFHCTGMLPRGHIHRPCMWVEWPYTPFKSAVEIADSYYELFGVYYLPGKGGGVCGDYMGAVYVGNPYIVTVFRHIFVFEFTFVFKCSNICEHAYTCVNIRIYVISCILYVFTYVHICYRTCIYILSHADN